MAQPARPRDLRSDKYRMAETLNGYPHLVFDAAEPADFDWLENAIHTLGYYEKAGTWAYGVDIDKKALALIGSYFAPRRALDVGCNNGPLIECLLDRGISAEGIEISRYAIEKAPETIRPLIHEGDVLEAVLPGRYDLVFGLDIFEHLNPNKIDAYIERIASLLTDEGFLFANIPAWGDDPVFGPVFPLARCGYSEAYTGWLEAAERREVFRLIPVDEDGFPLMGHLVWAGSDWWVDRFAKAGLERQVAIELALHQRFDWFFNLNAVGRRSFYVFGTRGASANKERVLARIAERELSSIVWR